MEARENNFKSIVTNENCLDIPFFQRHYTWNEEHWERLFDDLYDSFINNTTHFVGYHFAMKHRILASVLVQFQQDTRLPHLLQLQH